MSRVTKQSLSRLSQQFADVFLEAQEEYRRLLADLRDDDVDPTAFAGRTKAFHDRLLKLKRIRLQLRRERNRHVRRSGRDEAA